MTIPFTPYAPQRHEMAYFLEQVRKEICGYAGSRCDCKYGARMKGEETGCPEVSLASGIFDVMTDKEYNRFLKRWNKRRTKKNLEVLKASKLKGDDHG